MSLINLLLRKMTWLSRTFAKFTIDLKDVAIRLSYGSGPGGQSVNKSENCVNMIHIPTGILVKVHQSRDLEINKHIALKRLTEKVELSVLGKDSKIAKRIEKLKKNKLRRKKKYEDKHIKNSNEIGANKETTEADDDSSSEEC